jgi:hypothetical protein
MEIKKLDVIRFRNRLKAGDEIRTALVHSVTLNGDATIITYVPHATTECPDRNWCGHGSMVLKFDNDGELKVKKYGIQEVTVIDHLDRDPEDENAAARRVFMSAMYRNPGYDPMM